GQALERAPDALPALRALARLYDERRDYRAQAQTVEAEASASLDRERRAALEFEAAEIWAAQLGDATRAQTAYRRALEANPAHAGAIPALVTLPPPEGHWRK